MYSDEERSKPFMTEDEYLELKKIRGGPRTTPRHRCLWVDWNLQRMRRKRREQLQLRRIRQEIQDELNNA